MPHKYKSIEGWFDSGIAKVYDLLIHEANTNDSLIEIGTWNGTSLCYMLEQIEEVNKQLKVLCIDKFSGDEYGLLGKDGQVFDRFTNNMKNVGFTLNKDFTALIGDSIEQSKYIEDGSIFAIFLDGNHRTEYVSREIDAWLPKIQKGGILAFHDYKDFNLRQLFNSKLDNIEDYDSCGLWRKI